MKKFEKLFSESEIILTEGALVERLKSEFHLQMDENLNHAGLIYSHPEILKKIYQDYIDIGEKYDLPIMVMTPTRRVNSETIRHSKYQHKDVIPDTINFLNDIKQEYQDYSNNVLVGGLLGCKGDAYSGEKMMNTEESYHFHKKQVSQFQDQPVDFLFAGIMPEMNEALGMARAMSETEIPYIISFMIRQDGCLLDGTAISEAIEQIDGSLNNKPIGYMTNCVHPVNLRKALNAPVNVNSLSLKRFLGIQANASTLSPEDLNNCGVLKQDDFSAMVDEMKRLKDKFSLKIFGGCCGTNEIFIKALASQLKSEITNN